jgi:hypothetical protein
MSAYMVNEDTLDLLASVALWGREGLFVYFYEDTLPPRSDLTAVRNEGNYYREGEAVELIKEELRLENQASLRARYGDGEQFDKGEKFRPIWSDQATVGQALGALRCYEYQASESNEWRNSYAKALCEAIRRNLCARVSGEAWDYDRPTTMSERVRII